MPESLQPFEDWVRQTLGSVADGVATIHQKLIEHELKIIDLRADVDTLKRRVTPPGMPATRTLSDPPFDVKMKRYEDQRAAGTWRWILNNAATITMRVVQVIVLAALAMAWHAFEKH